ncbi:MAG: arylamine N-acetyltransferase [Armatimonadetes bacterium]|nr:arylamine N-acetyltransferase [Armatimonadota bacterium]
MPYAYDLDAYRRRIGFQGPFEPNLATLRQIAERHAQSIPFENLDVLLGRGINLDPEALERKLVHEARGGYCFEQNGLALGILRQIGFRVTPLSGRVRIESPRDFIPARTHLLLIIDLDGEEWLLDVGVGGYSLTSPLRRVLNEEQETLHEKRRLVCEDGMFYHQVWTGSDWLDVYEFTGEVMPEIDREVANWWTSTSPKAKFSQRLVCARALPQSERLSLLNDRLVRRRGPEILEELTVTSADHLLEILESRFGIRYPAGTRFGSGDKPWPTR